MANTLFDQLKKSGLVDDNKAKQSRKEKHRKARQQKGKQARPVNESSQRARQAQAEKVVRDRELNQQHRQAAARKAVIAQIKQLIEMNRLEDCEGEIGFNFTDGSNVQRLYITQELQQQLVRGQLAIVRMDGSYELVPAAVAEKIRQRDLSFIVLCNADAPVVSEANDPYADFPVPDDLVW